MATTIQECSSVAGAERRQKRKDRILSIASTRLEKILPGTNTHNLSDHLYYTARDIHINSSLPVDVTQEDSNMEQSLPVDVTQEDSNMEQSLPIDVTQEDSNMEQSLPLDATQEESNMEQTLNTTGEIDFVEPSYMDLIDLNRVQACVIAGVILRLLTFFHVIHSVSPFWIPLSLSYHAYLLTEVEKKFPKHGYIVNFLLAGGMNEKLVRYLGLIIDTLWSFAIDTMIMALGFFALSLLLCLYKF